MTKNIYFASDFHLGSPNYAESRKREDRIVAWLNFIEPTCSELYLMGDIFDFWFEYEKVIPKGFVRFQGKLAAMADAGIKIYFFKGNHDMWVRNYFTEEIGMEIISDELIIEKNDKKFYLHHGDGLGLGDRKYKFLRKIFRSPLCQWLFARLHPNLGIGIAAAWSGKSKKRAGADAVFFGENYEWLAVYSREILKKEHFDYFIYGHRHLPMDINLGNGSRYVNIGEWINYNSYGVFDGVNLELKYFKEN
ncbi:UDP-2,3-diacylglucosamine diphosphatase [Pedobacter sp. Leaf170]|uniref:UDP-2,3-diacylglucosamine diphosphatase n=1 Tax=Pedobacter sp. Leaf170 TaxID=2876558 RepID=UPI001E5873FE|nr:UDP-2,3-diacylglucosamine diphosphatase [Pedobacter sp. Leaf170]